MKAWLFTSPDEPLQLIKRPDPHPGLGQVVVSVRAAGLCHTDVGFMDGTILHMLPNPPPIILGHEVAGVVSAIGPAVADFEVGDRVVVIGPEAHAPGWACDGGYATHCVAMAAGLIRLPDAVSFAQGAAATDAGQTAYSGVIRAGEVGPGQRGGIIGLGGLGLTGARLAVLNGATVYGAEPRREVWGVAKAQGVEEVVSEAAELARFNLDTIIDFAGFGTTTAAAVKAVRVGGRVVLVGLGTAETTISSSDLVYKAVTLRGARGGAYEDTRAVIDHMARGELTIETDTIEFDEIPLGLQRLRRGGVVGRIVAEIN